MFCFAKLSEAEWLSSRQYVEAIKHGLQLIHGIEITFWTWFGHIFGRVFQESGLDKRQKQMCYHTGEKMEQWSVQYAS